MWSGGHAGIAVAVADKTPFVAQAERHKAIVTNDDALQAKQFVEIDRLASGFAEGAAPALDTLSRRMFAFNFNT
jgi:hypothetical protein